MIRDERRTGDESREELVELFPDGGTDRVSTGDNILGTWDMRRAELDAGRGMLPAVSSSEPMPLRAAPGAGGAVAALLRCDFRLGRGVAAAVEEEGGGGGGGMASRDDGAKDGR